MWWSFHPKGENKKMLCGGRCLHRPAKLRQPRSSRADASIGPYNLYYFQRVENLPLRGRCPEGAEGENLAIARNISGSRTVLSPTACGRSPLAEGAKG